MSQSQPPEPPNSQSPAYVRSFVALTAGASFLIGAGLTAPVAYMAGMNSGFCPPQGSIGRQAFAPGIVPELIGHLKNPAPQKPRVFWNGAPMIARAAAP